MDDPWMLWKYGGECTCVCARVFVVVVVVGGGRTAVHIG